MTKSTLPIQTPVSTESGMLPRPAQAHPRLVCSGVRGAAHVAVQEEHQAEQGRQRHGRQAALGAQGGHRVGQLRQLLVRQARAQAVPARRLRLQQLAHQGQQRGTAVCRQAGGGGGSRGKSRFDLELLALDLFKEVVEEAFRARFTGCLCEK